MYTDDQNFYIFIRKDAKVLELKRLAIEKAGLDISEENCRIRAYNTINYTLQDVYCDDLTLEE